MNVPASSKRLVALACADSSSERRRALAALRAIAASVEHRAGLVRGGVLDALILMCASADAREDAALASEAAQLADRLAQLDLTAHHETKLRVRRHHLAALRKALLADRADFVLKGAQRAASSWRPG